MKGTIISKTFADFNEEYKVDVGLCRCGVIIVRSCWRRR
jgi:hypothetical protein